MWVMFSQMLYQLVIQCHYRLNLWFYCSLCETQTKSRLNDEEREICLHLYKTRPALSYVNTFHYRNFIAGISCNKIKCS